MTDPDATVPDPEAAKRFEDTLATTAGETDPLVGVVLGTYRIDSVLGRGGMGVVYRGYDLRLERQVAVKTILFDRPAARARFQREARAQAQLRHPHVVAVHIVGEHAGLTYLVMDLVSGGSLRDLILEPGKIAEDRALAIADAVASALEAAHASGLIHRDVKPSNVLVEPDGNVLLTDFGLAKRVHDTDDPDAGPPPSAAPASLTRPGSVLGTPAYLAPEQERGERVDHRADMYALGITLHEMLAGARPGDGDSPAASKPETVAVVRKLLGRTPAERFATYSELRAALARAREAGQVAEASRLKRAIAFALDLVASFMAALVTVSVFRAVMSVARLGEPAKSSSLPLSYAVAGILFAAFEISFATTLGKRLFRLRDAGATTADRPGAVRLSFRAALKSLPWLLLAASAAEWLPKGWGLRSFALSTLVLGLPTFGRSRRALHDRVTGTRVVRIIRETHERRVDGHRHE